MLQVHIASEPAPPPYLPLQHGLMALLARSAAMGALPNERVTAIDPGFLSRLLDDLSQKGELLRSARLALAPLLAQRPRELSEPTAVRMAAEVARLYEALGESPSPATEWASMREVLGDEALSGLLEVAPASIRRYANGSRETPQKVAERLHWLALLVADLAGAYNAFGIRRWFERPRAQLAGLSPRQALGPDWLPDGAAAQQVRTLAAALSGAQPLAV